MARAMAGVNSLRARSQRQARMCLSRLSLMLVPLQGRYIALLPADGVGHIVHRSDFAHAPTRETEVLAFADTPGARTDPDSPCPSMSWPAWDDIAVALSSRLGPLLWRVSDFIHGPSGALRDVLIAVLHRLIAVVRVRNPSLISPTPPGHAEDLLGNPSSGPDERWRIAKSTRRLSNKGLRLSLPMDVAIPSNPARHRAALPCMAARK